MEHKAEPIEPNFSQIMYAIQGKLAKELGANMGAKLQGINQDDGTVTPFCGFGKKENDADLQNGKYAGEPEISKARVILLNNTLFKVNQSLAKGLSFTDLKNIMDKALYDNKLIDTNHNKSYCSMREASLFTNSFVAFFRQSPLQSNTQLALEECLKFIEDIEVKFQVTKPNPAL